MNSISKKEVSNRGMHGVIDSLIEKKFDEKILLDGIPYDLSYLKNRHQRIERWVYCNIIANLRPYFTQKEFEKLNGCMVSRENSSEVFSLDSYYLVQTDWQDYFIIKFGYLVRLCSAV
ncbi:MAG: hypothetical protein R6W68_12080 [Ignavibacteriaceae bacterium]